MCSVGNLWISEPSFSKLEKFQRSLALPNIKYNCAVLLWSQLYWVFIYDSKYIFIDTNAKMWTEIIDFVVLGRNYWSSCRVTHKELKSLLLTKTEKTFSLQLGACMTISSKAFSKAWLVTVFWAWHVDLYLRLYSMWWDKIIWFPYFVIDSSN